MHSTDAAFLYQLRARFGSGAALGQGGHRFGSIKKVTESTAAEIRHEVDRIARPFVEKRDLEIVRVRVETEGAAAYVVVDWHNRRADAARTVRVPA